MVDCIQLVTAKKISIRAIPALVAVRALLGTETRIWKGWIPGKKIVHTRLMTVKRLSIKMIPSVDRRHA